MEAQVKCPRCLGGGEEVVYKRNARSSYYSYTCDLGQGNGEIALEAYHSWRISRSKEHAWMMASFGAFFIGFIIMAIILK